MDVSENSGTPKSSILIGYSIINHPFWGTPIFGNTHIQMSRPRPRRASSLPRPRRRLPQAFRTAAKPKEIGAKDPANFGDKR